LSEVWSAVTKAGIAEAVLALTKLDEDRRSSLDCLQTPSVWLTLAALCLLQDEHVERLSSTQWARGAVNKVNYLLLTSVHVSEFFLSVSRSVTTTTTGKQGHKLSVPTAGRFVLIAIEFCIFRANFAPISVR
jgi:hypothetical protein